MPFFNLKIFFENVCKFKNNAYLCKRNQNLKTMKRKTVKTEFEVTTTNAGKVFAKVGDIITISNRDAEHYNILKVNDIKIFSRWMRKAWVNAKCN